VPRLEICSRHPSADLALLAKQSPPHDWQISRAPTAPRSACGFQSSLTIRLHHKIVQAARKHSFEIMRKIKMFANLDKTKPDVENIQKLVLCAAVGVLIVQTEWVVTYIYIYILYNQGDATFSMLNDKHQTTHFTFNNTERPRRNGQNFGSVFLMLNYTDITQNTYIQSWTVTEIMAIDKCGLLGCPRTVRRLWRHTHPLRMAGSETPLANVAMQWPWRDYASDAACVKCLVTLRTIMTWVRVFL